MSNTLMGNTSPDAARASAEAELARLAERIATMRAVLVRLLQEVVQAEARLGRVDHARATELVEVNEQLVVSALLSQTESDSAFQLLDESARASELDPLTQLPNRTLLLDRLTQAIAHAKRHDGGLALLFLDLDRFKQINDMAGHAAGDAVLRLVAQRLQGVVRKVDTVSRHGGDEFLVLLTDVAQRDDVGLVAEKLIAALAAPNELDIPVDHLSASIGISLYPTDGHDADTLIAQADAAMYHAKRQRPGGYDFSEPVLPRDE